MPLSSLTAYAPVPENSAATPGLFDSRFNTVHANIQAVDTTVSQVSLVLSSVSGSGISGLRDVTLVRYGGAVGDGTTDDRAAFNAGATSVATQAVLYVPSSASVYRIASAFTIVGMLSPIPGAILRPTSGTTVYIRGPLDAGPYQIFDSTLGGGFDFTGNTNIHRFFPQWFGVQGLGASSATADTAALNSMSAMLPGYSTVEYSGLKIHLTKTWLNQATHSVRHVCHSPPIPDGGGNSCTFRWAGPPSVVGSGASMTSGSSILDDTAASFSTLIVGQHIFVEHCGPSDFGVADTTLSASVASRASSTRLILDTNASVTTSARNYLLSGVMILFDSCDHPVFSGFNVEMDSVNTAYRGVVTDRTGIAGATGTNGIFSFNRFYVQNPSFDTNFGALDINPAGASNQEYHHIWNNDFNGGVGAAYLDHVQAASGSSVITTDGTFQSFWFAPAGTARRFRSSQNGAGGGMLDTTLSRFSSSTQATIAVNATGANNTRAFIGGGTGWGVRLGANANTKKIDFKHNQFSNWSYAVWMRGGSAHFEDESYTNDEVDIQADSLSEPCFELGPNVEQSRQHLVLGPFAAQPWFIKSGRLQSANPVMSDGVLGFHATSSPGGLLSVEDTQFADTANDPTTSLYSFLGAQGVLSRQRNYYPSLTRAQVGDSGSLTAGFAINREYEIGITDSTAEADGANVRRHAKYTNFIGGTSDAVFTADAESPNGNPTAIGLRGRADIATGGGGGSTLVGVQGEVGSQNIYTALAAAAYALRALPPSILRTATLAQAAGLRVESPSAITAGGSITAMYGIYIDSQNTTGIVTPWGIYQAGTTEANYFGSPSFFATGSTTSPSIGFSSESSLGFYRSGVSTIAPSTGTLNLALNGVRLSLRTQASLDSTNLAVNEFAITINGSGATAAFRSNGTVYYWASSTSTKG